MKNADSNVASNALANETSLYLRQHATNPVQWHAWNDESLKLARDSGKPILLSIGYSACHWCHVMAHESFEDEAIAAIMNEHFINIKVDREERPDLDKIYQFAHQVLTQRPGGWPLTMFLTHDDHMPFFGGTYFPPAPRHGLPSFPELLLRVAMFYQERSGELRQQNEALKKIFIDNQPELTTQPSLDDQPLQQARTTLEAQFDTEFGGFGGAPKFPHSRTLEFLLRQWHASSGNEQPDLHALFMSALTLTRMAEGGMYDQLGWGFFRYSVDRYWMIPHFEKMLYDNAELLRVYAQAATATGDPLFKRVARETAAWLLRDMRSPSHAFWSTLDADSEGQEGKFYVWDKEEIRKALPDNEYKVLAQRYGLDNEPNFSEHGHHYWHLHAYRSMEEVATQTGLTLDDTYHELQHAQQRLLAIRNQRVWPGRDEKVLTAWNALAIGALAIASRNLVDERSGDAACNALDQLRTHVWKNGQLFAVQSDDQVRFEAYLDDYAYLLDATVEVMQYRWRDIDLQFASELADALLDGFEDREKGGFFFTSNHHEQLIHRPKTFSDEAIPSGNAIAAQALLRLGFLLGNTRYLQAAEKVLIAASPALQRYPSGHTSMLIALSEHLSPPQIIVIRGDAQEASHWQRSLNTIYQPRRMILSIPSDAVLPESLAVKKPIDSGIVAYICVGETCSEPVRSLEALIALSR
ncbi:MAG TPA: thioredoxin domain-containing protein, partial [Steroidobacteraceae bacterium]|nr:thioredoxin domain-containing protein [Steroidobacteraceae bacterium]